MKGISKLHTVYLIVVVMFAIAVGGLLSAFVLRDYRSTSDYKCGNWCTEEKGYRSGMYNKTDSYCYCELLKVIDKKPIYVYEPISLLEEIESE